MRHAQDDAVYGTCPGGTPKTKLSTAPAPAARQHGRRLTHIDPLVLVVAPPPTESLFTLPVLKYRHIPKVPYADIRIVRPTAKGPVFHPIDNFVMNITAAAAIAREG